MKPSILDIRQFGIGPESNLDHEVARGLCRDLTACLDVHGAIDAGVCLRQAERPLEVTPRESREPHPRRPARVLTGMLELTDSSLQCFVELHDTGGDALWEHRVELPRNRRGALPEKLLPDLVSHLGHTPGRSWLEFLQSSGAHHTESYVALCRALERGLVDESRLEMLETLCSVNPDFSRARAALLASQLAMGLLDSARHSEDLLPQARPQDAHLWTLAARWARHGGVLNAAADYLETSLKLMPTAAWLRYHLGVVNHDRGNPEAARNNLDRAVLGGFESADCLNRLGILLAEGTAAQKRPVSLWNRALELDPEFAPAWANLSRAALERNDLELASLYIEKAIALWPDFAGFHYNLGVIHQSNEQLEAAEASYRRALELDDTVAMAWNNLGVCLKQRGKLDHARKQFQRALTLDAAGEAGRLARENLDEMDRRRLELRHREIFSQLGDDALHGDPAPAIHGLEELLRTREDFWNAWYALGVAHRRAGNLDRAEFCLRKVLQLKDDQPDTHYQLAVVLMKRGHLHQALEHARRAYHLTDEDRMLQLATDLQGRADPGPQHEQLVQRCTRRGIEPTWQEEKTDFG